MQFKSGKFLLTTSDPKTRLNLHKNEYWKVSDGNFVTSHLGAAVTFRQYGDENAEKILNQTLQTHYDLPSLPPLTELDPHQREGVEWILRRKRSYLAHAPGAGKTAQAILCACFAKGPGQVLFIVPPSLTLNWEREILHFSPWAGNFNSIAVVPTSDRKEEMNWAAHFIICPDSMLTKSWVHSRLQRMKKKFIAVDEASRFKDPFAERSLAFYGGSKPKDKKVIRYPALFREARHVVFLDGSPMPNRPIELWAPTYALHPEAIDCRNYDDFGYRYCGAKPNDRGQWEYLYSSNEEELRAKLRHDFMHVVTEDALTHPERLRSMVMMNEDVRTAEHKAWERQNLPKLSSISEDASQGDVARYRRELGLRKVKWVAKYVGERLRDKNESILVFAWHRDVCTQLADAFKDMRRGLVMGGMNSLIRERFFSEFQDGESRLLIMNIAAGGRGHNLQRADRVIFAEWSWTDETNRQCEKRASRKGNDRDFVRCEYIVAPDSMDEMVLQSVFTKEKRVKRIIG
jgi:SWI/SNF-related matrix-associated actin-dependent regulator of chromatin subfamily A-like protein 1